MAPAGGKSSAHGIASALEQAKAADGGKDVRVSGGADTIRQFLRAKPIDDVTLRIAPVLLGDGLPLFETPNPTM